MSGSMPSAHAQHANRHNGGMSSNADARPTKGWPSVLLLVGSLVPGAVALLPLAMGPAWYLSADENQPYLTGARVNWMLTVFAIALAPFLGAVVALLSVRFVGHGWGLACRTASAWAFGLGCLAVVTAMVYGGGF
jgi:hypothetical protein